jgi:hypothetical protein
MRPKVPSGKDDEAMARKRKLTDDRSMSPLLGVPARGVIPRRVFRSVYPLSYALGLRFVSLNGNESEGFDIDEVEKKLGTDRFKSLLTGLKEVFCCGHRNWPADHQEPNRRNCEVHCVWARDLEAFLRGPSISREGS